MLDAGTRARLLQHYPSLAELPQAELDTMLASATVIPVPQGTVVFDENQPCQGFPMLLSGSLRVIAGGQAGATFRLRAGK